MKGLLGVEWKMLGMFDFHQWQRVFPRVANFNVLKLKVTFGKNFIWAMDSSNYFTFSRN